jgi:hypothetical protein
MAGRPRRRRSSSASSIETGHSSQIRYWKESRILKPASRDVPDVDWPIYVLTDATIYRKDGKTLANPLLVNVQGPMVVRGFLEEIEDDDDDHDKPSNCELTAFLFFFFFSRSGAVN